jgi:two-component system response regulator PilR (NtrC family)
MSAIALVVDDEVDLCRLMQITLTKMGIKSHVAYDLATANQYLDETVYDFCLTDLRLPDGSGLELVKRISASAANTPVAVITAHGNMDLAIQALKLGAFDFVNKPLELPRLRQLVENALKVAEQANMPANAEQKSPEQQLLDKRLIGSSVAIQQLKATIVKLARSQAPVFLWGASGTGKEVVARLIHDLSPRREGSFVPVNCGAIPSELMESEFFGHKKGSFTGASADKIGLFQQASGGTLFLDEVADLPLAMQVKLLRAIQEKTIRPIGDTKEVSVDVRILSATHKDLSRLVQAGEFRQDLFYRINVIELKLPTLNARDSDIPVLAQHFLRLIAEDWQLETAPELTAAACEHLKTHDFAGNVRELRNLLERAVTLTESPVIDVEHLGIDTAATPAPDSVSTLETQATSAATDNGANVGSANVASSATNSEPVSSVPPTATNAQVQQPEQSYLTEQSKVEASTAKQNYSANMAPTTLPQPTIKISAHEASSPKPSGHSAANTLADTSDHALASPDLYDESKAFADKVSAAVLKKTTASQLPKEGLEAYLQEQEKMLILTALQQTNGNKTKAAELLGTTFRSLRYRMKKLELEESSSEEES